MAIPDATVEARCTPGRCLGLTTRASLPGMLLTDFYNAMNANKAATGFSFIQNQELSNEYPNLKFA